MPALVLACLAYLTVALPSSALGLLWPSMRLSFHEPVAALGILLACGVTASVVSSAATGRILSRVGVGLLLAVGTMLTAVALAVEALAPSLWVVASGFVLFGLGFGAIDSALNAHAARHFGARQITWMHASYGLGATTGPLFVTAFLSDGLSWRWTYGAMAVALVVLGWVIVVARHRWDTPALPLASPSAHPTEIAPDRLTGSVGKKRSVPAMVGALCFVAVETGIESGTGVWGYIFLTAGHGLSREAAAVAVAAYWATMFVGRAVLGPVAERVGPARVLWLAAAGVTVGAALMTVPDPGLVAVLGMMTVGFAAAPIFPLFTLTTAQREGAGGDSGITRMVTLQVAASAVGGAAVPAGIGLVIEAFNASVLAPSLLVLGLSMGTVYGLLSVAVA